MTTYGLSKATLDRALRDLEAEGLLTRVHGSGIYVRQRQVVARDLVAGWQMEYQRAKSGKAEGVGLFEAMTGNAADVQITFRETGVSERIAEILGLEPGAKVLERTWRYVVGGQPHQVARSYMPIATARAADLAPESEVEGIGTMAQLRRARIVVTRVRLELESRMPSAEESRELALQPETPVFEHHRSLYEGSSERAAETGVAVVPADRIACVFNVDLEESE